MTPPRVTGGGVAACVRAPRCLNSAGMTAIMSGIILVSAFGLVALACLALAIALLRVTGRPAAVSAGDGTSRQSEQ